MSSLRRSTAGNQATPLRPDEKMHLELTIAKFRSMSRKRISKLLRRGFIITVVSR